MKKLIAIVFILVAALWVVTPHAQAAELQAEGSAMLAKDFILEDKRAEVLATFLKKNKSPLAGYAGQFIEAADAYSLDWKLVPAITGVESTFGRQIPYGSYNAYGWANGAYRFTSWENSIWHVNRVLKEKYVNRGAVTVWQVGKIYATSPTWAGRVESLMKKIAACQNFVFTL